jgi:eukaryotic-like serine/threonine-protein kinase
MLSSPAVAAEASPAAPHMHHEEFAGTSRFRVLAKLGAGGMGVVYRAYDHQQGRDVALKTLQRFDATRLYRFKREFRALADVAHPNLVSLYELLGERNSWFFTMELLEAVEFRAWAGRPGATAGTASGTSAALRDITLPQRTPSLPAAGLEIQPGHAAGGCDVERLRPTLRQLARGVDALHKAGWLHCDIKPSNVLVTNQGRVVLVDFGLVTESQPANARQSSGERLIGTPAYMSPEQAAGDPLGTMSDWYSVGVMLYEVLTGRLPFEGTMVDVLTSKQRAEPQPPSALATVPADLDDLCMALLRRRPEDRPKGEEVMARLGEVASKLAVAERSRARAPVFLGRIDELQALTDAYAAAREGTPVTLHVHGGSGMGKTALVARFLEQVRADPQATVLAGRCYERESMPYKALDSVVDDLSRHLHRLGGDAAALMPRHVRSLVRLFPVLKRAEAVGRAPLPPIEIPDRQELRRRAFGALKELLARIADRGPVVLWIDDAQWGDVDSAALLTEMARPPDAPALLLVLSYRTEDRARSACLQMLQAAGAGADSDVRELRVGPLLPADAHDLARALLPRADAGRAAQVAQEAEGNPLFVAELALHGTLERATLEEMLLSRVAQLPAGARDLLEVIAVASGPIEPVTALRAAEPTGDGLAALAILRAGRLVRAAASGEQIETYHDRIRESVTLHLSAARLRECHAALARALEARPGADPEALAVHLHAAGELVRAGEQAAAAARAAAEALAFDRAARLYRLALDVAPADASARLRLQVELGTALANAGRGAEAAEIYLAAAANAREGQALDLRRRAAEQLLISGHVPQGLAALRVVVEGIGMRIAPTPRLALVRLLLARLRIRLRGLSSRERRPEEIDPDELMRIDVCRSAAIGLSMIDTIRGAEFQSRYALLALRSGEPSRIASALSLEGGHVASIGGRRAERLAERILGRAESLARRSGQPYPLALLEFARGAGDFLNGRWKLSVERCDSAAEVFRDRCTGAAWEADTSRWFAASARFYLGHFRELGRRLTLLVDEARARGDLYASTLFSTLLAQSALVAADQAERARTTLERARAEWHAEGFHIQHYWMLLGEGFVDLYDGQGRRAWERVQASWPAFTASQLPRVGMVEAQLLHLRGAAALAAATQTEDAAEAAALLEIADRAAGGLLRGRIVPFRSIGLLLRAGVSSAGKRPERAASMFQDAAERLDEVGMTLYAAAARRRWAEVIGGRTGRDGLRAAEGSMAAEGICNPARMTQMLAPGRVW